MSRIIGCEHLHIAPIKKDDLTGSEWGDLVPVPSLISIDITDQRDDVTFYSDNVIEQVIPAFSGKEVTIELGYLTNELGARHIIANSVDVLETLWLKTPFLYVFPEINASKSKGGFSYLCLYKGVLARTESNFKTKEDSIESSTVSLTGVFMPLVSNGLVAIKADSDDKTPSALINTWFTEVPVQTQGGSTEGRIDTKKK